MTELPSLWPHQERGLAEVIRHLEAGVRHILLTSPTGGGKTRLLQEVISHALDVNWPVTLYTNRNLLRQQTSQVLTKWGFSHGLRAAGCEADLEKMVQIVSVQSETNRVFGTKKKPAAWEHHRSKIVITDEVHLNQGDKIRALKCRHDADGSLFLDITATPLDLVEKYDVMVQAGTTSELRECGSLLFARHHAINEPDSAKVKPNASGEYEIEPGVFRKIWLKSVVGSVIDNYRALNPNRLPTILFAPGVKESIWFAERFTEAGIRWAHIDGSSVWLDGETYTGEAGQRMRDEILKPERDGQPAGLLRTGKIAGVSNRFVLREGVDVPELYHAILATVFGDLKNFIQSVGRVLRNHSSLPGHVIIQDHGGNWWRHGSPNADRIWELGQQGRILNALREERIREGKEATPLICPFCKALRMSGAACQACGKAIAAGRSRQVIQHDGELREVSGPIVAPKRIKCGPDVEELWQKYYFRAKKSRKGMTFRQARGLMVYENGFWPPDGLKFMPRDPKDWFLKVCDVLASKLL